jgi:hypothetical protein
MVVDSCRRDNVVCRRYLRVFSIDDAPVSFRSQRLDFNPVRRVAGQVLFIITQTPQVLDRRLSLKIKYDTDRWLKEILLRNDTYLNIVDVL